MIRFGVRLAVAGGREAILRLAMVAAAVAIGSTLLLATFATLHAVGTQNQRFAWLETGYVAPTQPSTTSSVDPLWWRLRADVFHGDLIGRVDVAATGPNSPVPPGIPALPAPGELYVSPALADLMTTMPPAELAARYPGTVVGEIGRDGLPSPDSLLAIGGVDADVLAAADAQLVTEISTTGPADCQPGCAPFVGTNDNAMTLILSVVAAALLFPVMVFVAGATRLSAARREQRFAAMRLVGATPKQIGAIATVESSVAAVIGVVAGFGLFAVLRPLLALIPFSTDPFFTSDVALTPRDALLVGLGVPIAAAVSARVALRRVVTSPLGVSRRTAGRRPRPWLVLPLVAGVVWLGYLAFFSDIGASHDSAQQAFAYLAGVFAMMIGLVVAGPWFTAVAARLTARRTDRPAGLLAARRLGDDPHTAFRAVSGVVLAVFVGSCAIGVITTVVANNGASSDGSAGDRSTLVHEQLRIGPGDPMNAFDGADRAVLLATPGVEGVAILHRPEHLPVGGPDGAQLLVSCAELATTPALGRCAPNAVTTNLELRLGGAVVDHTETMTDTTWPASDVTLDALAELPIDAIAVATDGTPGAVERARTVLERQIPATFAPETISELRARNTDDINRMQRLAAIVMLASLPIAGCSLAVNVAGGLAERRRPFSLLRLTGVPLSTLRRVIAFEAVVPLLVSVVVAAGSGFAAAGLFVRAQLDQTLEPPGVHYYVLLAAGVATSLAIIASTLPLLATTTGPESARQD